MSVSIKIKKGINIRLQGEADKVYANIPLPEHYAIKPHDFHGVIPKLIVKEGDHVKAGSPLFYSKDNPKFLFTSPVSGKISTIKRGEKRKILEIGIQADQVIQYETFSTANPNELSREDIIKTLLKSGVWPLIRQRPYAVIANPDDKPKSIFISGFDSHPLAPDNDFIVHGCGEIFQIGLEAIIKLTDGKVHLNVKANEVSSKVLTNSKRVQINYFSGPHPAGNVGVQINHIDPINKGDIVWYLYPQDVLTIGRLFKEGKYDASRVVALTGSEVKHARYYKTMIGSSVKNILKDNLQEGHIRIISGNVLTGTTISPDGFIGFYDTQITVIPEGDYSEFLGWLAPGLDKFSKSRTFFSWLMPNKIYRLDTNLHGEKRAFVMMGEYEDVFPMDIYPVQLLKAILTQDIEMMEQLGIYEVAPEDFALCEFICTSKINAQEIVRNGLDLVRKECE